MAVYSANEKNSVKFYLNNGTTTSGKLKTVTVSLPKLKSSPTFTNTELQKCLNIMTALSAVFSKNIEYARYTTTITFEEE